MEKPRERGRGLPAVAAWSMLLMIAGDGSSDVGPPLGLPRD